MIQIHCMNNISEKGLNLLGDSYTLVESLDSASGLILRSAKIHDTQFPSSLIAIARAGAGVNNIPLDRCAEEGIVVFNTPGANANAVKELVLAGLLLSSRKIMAGAQWCRDNAHSATIGKDAEKAKKQFGGNELAGRKMGVVGLGAIGVLVANAALSLGMEVYGYDPFVSVESAWNLSKEVHKITDLKMLCSECDYISIHVPAMEQTRGMIGEEQFSCMKESAVLLNFSRDVLVDEDALVNALKNGNLSYYVTDFATPAVMKIQEDKTLVLPHLGASTVEAEENCAIMAVNQMRDFMENGNIVNSVNFPNVELGPLRSYGQRITIAHRNIPGVINSITQEIANCGYNLANITSKAKGNTAYAIIDIDEELEEGFIDKIKDREGVYRVRVL